MSQKFHMCVDISGALKNWSDRLWRGVVTDDNGRVLTLREAKQYFRAELAKGRAVLPCSDCDNFDYQTGCQGHEE